MYIVQDRTTGLYFRNSRSNGKRYGRSEWVPDLEEVLPIRTLNAVKQMFKSTGGIQYEFSKRRWQKDPTLPACCAAMGYSRGKVTRQCEHYKAAVAKRFTEVGQKYRVIRVTLQLREEEAL